MKGIYHITPEFAFRIAKNVRPGALWHNLKNYIRYERYVNSRRGPITAYIELTTECNRDCIGCYIPKKERREKDVVTEDITNKLMDIGNDFGIIVYTLLGGEPLGENTHKIVEDILSKNPKYTFFLCTNGDYIAEKKEKLDDIILKDNLIIALSIDGFKETNDRYRGKDSFNNVMTAAQYLKSRKNLFTAISTFRNGNIDEVTSKEFIDMLSEKGISILSYSFPTSLSNANEEYAINRINNIDSPIIIYSGKYGHQGDCDEKKMSSRIVVDKHGNILYKRKQRTILGDILSLEDYRLIQAINQ